jgi:hypothetical protein
VIVHFCTNKDNNNNSNNDDNYDIHESYLALTFDLVRASLRIFKLIVTVAYTVGLFAINISSVIDRNGLESQKFN